MLYENLINSDKERLGKIIIENQRKHEMGKNWYKVTREMARKINIRLEKAEKGTKYEWKNLLRYT